jgi:DMSO reductase anchor subunit
MPLLDSVPVAGCHECVAMLTLPLALFLLLAETAVGGFATVAYLRLTGGLTHGFLKFIAVTYAILGALAFLVVLAIPQGAYHRLLSIDQSAAGALVFLQGLLVVALVVHAVVIWRQNSSRLSWVLTLTASLLLLAGIAAALWPLAGSLLNGAAIALVVALSAAVLGAATTGMLLGHWYLVTPALTNRPLLRAIGVLLVSLVVQAVVFPLTLRGLAHGSGSLTHPLTLSPVLSLLWALGAVLLPLVAAGLALPTCRLRSFMSTTGLLYLAMIAILPGQLLGQLLFFVAASA